MSLRDATGHSIAKGCWNTSICSLAGSSAIAGMLLLAAAVGPVRVRAQSIPIPHVQLKIDPARSPREAVASLQILLLLTVLAFVPSLLIMTSSFTRILIVFSLVRQALGLQQTPPNQVLIALSLFMTLFVMRPQLVEMNDKALQPYLQGKINEEAAFNQAMGPLKKFMLAQTRRNDLGLFKGLAHLTPAQDVPPTVVIPAFLTSELKTAFQIGFLIFVPFVLVDLIVATTLMSMGMMMVPPTMIALPVKLLLFVLVDGWHLIISGLISSFR